MTKIRTYNLTSGIILLDKPSGMSSNFALQKVKRIFNAKKAGHTGNLDPLATGMLPICLNEATKFSSYALNANKTYQVTAKWGEQTDTADSEGEVIATSSPPQLTESEFKIILNSFLGESSQIPPMYSALKHQGQKLYELARKGQIVERAPRNITIYQCQLISLSEDSFSLEVKCSKGTYIRTLVEDIAKACDSLAHVTALRRTEIEGFAQNPMLTLEHITAQSLLLPVQHLTKHLPSLIIDDEQCNDLQCGRLVHTNSLPLQQLLQLFTAEQRFIGLGIADSVQQLKAKRLMSTA